MRSRQLVPVKSNFDSQIARDQFLLASTEHRRFFPAQHSSSRLISSWNKPGARPAAASHCVAHYPLTLPRTAVFTSIRLAVFERELRDVEASATTGCRHFMLIQRTMLFHCGATETVDIRMWQAGGTDLLYDATIIQPFCPPGETPGTAVPQYTRLSGLAE